jgi:nicotinamide mononucleotide transporter
VKSFKLPQLSLYEKLWFIVFTGTGVTLSFLWGDTITGFVAFISGILCVLLAAKGSRWNYVAGVLNCVAYAWVSYQVGLYGEVMLNMMFYFPLQFIGFYLWSKKTKTDGIVEMGKLTLLQSGIVLTVCPVVVCSYGIFLSTLQGQVNPFIDSTTTVLSIGAAILMLKRFREFWLFYIIVNIVSIFMWSLRFGNGDPDASLMIVMWSAYLVNSVYGAYVWYKGTKAGASSGN